MEHCGKTKIKVLLDFYGLMFFFLPSFGQNGIITNDKRAET